MGELIQLGRIGRVQQAQPEICQAVSDVFLLSDVPSDELLATGKYVTAADFARAANLSGENETTGYRVMSDIATKLVSMLPLDTPALPESDEYTRYHGRKNDLVLEISGRMNNPRRIREGSRSQLLLGEQLVRDVWAVGEGSELVRSKHVPLLSSMGRHIVTRVVEILA